MNLRARLDEMKREYLDLQSKARDQSLRFQGAIGALNALLDELEQEDPETPADSQIESAAEV